MTVNVVIRMLRRAPAFSMTAVGTIGLAIALASVVFAIVDGVLFKPLPYAHPEQLFDMTGSDGGGGSASLAPADIAHLRRAEPRVAMTAFRGGQGMRHPDRPDVVLWA